MSLYYRWVEGFYYRDSLRNVEMSQMGLIVKGNNGPMDSVVMISFFLQSKLAGIKIKAIMKEISQDSEF